MKPEEALARAESIIKSISGVLTDEGTSALRIVLAMAKAADGLARSVSEMLEKADEACNPHADECETEADEGCTCWVGRDRAALAAFRKASGGDAP